MMKDKSPAAGHDPAADPIILRRECVAVTSTHQALDGKQRRALAGARLRALLFAAKPERLPAAKTVPVEDADLLAYLLDALPLHETRAMEDILSSDTQAFARLADLYAALIDRTSGGNPKDNQILADKAPAVQRHATGVIEIRGLHGFLQFKSSLDTDETGEDPPSASLQSARAPDTSQPARYRLPPKSTMPELNKSAGWDVFKEENERNEVHENLLQTAAGLAASLDRAMNLVRRCESLVPTCRDLDGSQAGTSLAGLMSDLHSLQTRISRGFDDVQAIIGGELKRAMGRPSLPSSSFSPARSRRAPSERRARVREARSLLVHEMWSDAINIDVGRWKLHLSGIAAPAPELAISLRGGAAGGSSDAKPVLTLVQPSQSFDLVELDFSGRGRVALPPGESVMLVQSEAVWEVRLIFQPA